MGDAQAHPLMLFVFILANVAISLGYVFMAVAVMPKVAIQLWRTRIGGIGFFLFCGLTHLSMAVMAIRQDEHESVADVSTAWGTLAIHLPQAVFVWMFVTGIYIEMGDFGLLRTRERRDADAFRASQTQAQQDRYAAEDWTADPEDGGL